MDLANQIIALRRQVESLKNTDVVFNTEPKNPTPSTIWVDTTARATKYWDGSNWVITGGALTDWNMSVVFTASDYRTIAWATGVVSIGTAESKTDYATTSGNFTMSATTYFYWQEDAPTSIQTTTTAGSVVTAGGVLLAVGRLNPDTANKASLKVFGGPSVDQIIADEIVANSITTNMLQANSVTAAKISVTNLAAINADLGAITAGTITVVSGGNTVALTPGATNAIIAGPTGSPTFTLTSAGVLTATGAVISGSLTATTGAIGGFSIGADYVRDAADSFGLASTVTWGDDVRFWAGAAFASRSSAPFRVTEAGAITATTATITGALTTAAGSVITTTYLSGIVGQSNLNVANAGWTQTSAFSVTDLDTVAWSSGSFIASTGTTYSISSGNTGNMAAKTYIYLDTAVSSTVYQTTTSASTAVGAGKVLVAIAQNGAVEATFQVMGTGGGGMNIDAASIVAGSITANEIAASTITAGKMSVTTLSSIVADLGAITAGTLTINTSGYVRGGQTDYATGTGFFLGYSGAAYKFSVGSATDYITFSGTAVAIQCSAADAITIDSASNIKLNTGGDIKFESVTSPTACTATLVATGTGNVDNGSHTYKVTFVTADGETSTWTASNSVTVDGTHKQVSLSAIPVSTSSNVTSRRIYRTKVSDGFYYLLATIANNTATTYTDNTADASLTGSQADNRANNTAGTIYVDSVAVLGLSTSNCFIWQTAGLYITTGYENVAFGFAWLKNNSSGHGNTGVWHFSLLTNTVGDSNTGLWYAAASNSDSWSFNTAVWASALSLNASGDRNVCLWYFAGAFETGSNAFYVNNQNRSNTAGDKAKSLLYGVMASAAADQKLTINGLLNQSVSKTPSSAADTGTAGDIAWDASYIYVCTASNTWKRVAIATW